MAKLKTTPNISLSFDPAKPLNAEGAAKMGTLLAQYFEIQEAASVLTALRDQPESVRGGQLSTPHASIGLQIMPLAKGKAVGLDELDSEPVTVGISIDAATRALEGSVAHLGRELGKIGVTINPLGTEAMAVPADGNGEPSQQQ